jgi:hypothetical protein
VGTAGGRVTTSEGSEDSLTKRKDERDFKTCLKLIKIVHFCVQHDVLISVYSKE